MKPVKSRTFHRLRLIFDKRITVANALDTACRAHGDQPIFYLDDPLPYLGVLGREVTPNVLREFANRLANVLVEHGLRRHDRVLIFKTHSPDYFFLALSVIRAGGIAVPVNPGMAPDGIRDYATYTGARFVITDAATFARQIRDPAAFRTVSRWLFTDETSGPPEASVQLPVELAAAACSSAPPVELCRDDDVLIVHTSGTTGFPKGVILSNSGIVRGLRGLLLSQPVTRNTRGMMACPQNHFITFLSQLSSLVGGMPMWLVTRFSAPHALSTIQDQRINLYFGFPDTYLAMYQEGIERYRLDSMRIWMAAADSSHEAHIRAFTRTGAFLRVFGRPLIKAVFVDMLGTSEVGYFALCRLAFSWSKRFGRYIGRPWFVGPRVRVTDENGKALPNGVPGRLMVRGPTLFKGYWNAHDRLHGVMRDGWWWTGDIARRDASGRFYHLDRAVDTVQSRNGPIYTLPIEEWLMAQPHVHEAVVIGIPDATRGEVAIALVSARLGETVDAQALLAAVNASLPVESRLAYVRLTTDEQIPRGLTGKVLKRQLRERFALPALPASERAEMRASSKESGVLQAATP